MIFINDEMRKWLCKIVDGYPVPEQERYPDHFARGSGGVAAVRLGMGELSLG